MFYSLSEYFEMWVSKSPIEDRVKKRSVKNWLKFKSISAKKFLSLTFANIKYIYIFADKKHFHDKVYHD